MRSELPADWTSHHSSTGHDFYDSIAFSAPPLAAVLDTSCPDVAAILHKEFSEKPLQIELEVANYDLIILSLLGGARYSFADGRSIKHRFVRQNDISFVPAGTYRRLEVWGATNTLTLSLPKGLLDQFSRENVSVSQTAFSDYEDRKLEYLMRILALHQNYPGFAAETLTDGLICAISNSIYNINRNIDPRSVSRICIAPRRLADVLEYIDSNLARSVRLRDLADIAGLSVFHFARAFKYQTGSSPYRLVCERRLNLACSLLAQNQLPLADLAQRCGFSSQVQFTAAFSKQIGMPPGQYRKLTLQPTAAAERALLGQRAYAAL